MSMRKFDNKNKFWVLYMYVFVCIWDYVFVWWVSW